MPHLLVRHKVADFDRWKRVFDSHAEAQRQAGLRLTHLMRNVDDTNEVVLLFDVDDIARAKAFTSAPEAYEAADVSGVTDTPDAYFLS